jgi:hypothetical protein
MEAKTYKSQVLLVHDLSIEIFGRHLTGDQLGAIFNVTRGPINTMLREREKVPKESGGQCIFNAEQELEILQYVQDQYNNDQPLQPSSLLRWVSEVFQESPTYGWLQSFLRRHRNIVREVDGSYQEDCRLRVPGVHLTKHVKNLRKYVAGTFADLVFNMDEAGASDYEDRGGFKTIVPSTVHDYRVQYPIERRFQHSTLLACISASGNSLTPLIIAPECDLQKIIDLGWRENEDFMYRSRQPCYITKELFLEYIETIFIPHVNRLRENPLYKEKRSKR